MRTEHQFWNWVKDKDTGERVLYLEGPIDQDSFWGDEVTPQAFKEQLESGDGDIVVYITSPGGNVFAASDIYTMLLEYKGKVTVKISSIAASAASVIAMAGDVVKMSPTAQLMIHNPITVAVGNEKVFQETIVVLGKVKESLINAYHLKTGLSRAKVASLLDGPTGEGTWLPAEEALKLGFIDEIITRPAGKKDEPEEDDPEEDDPEGEPGTEEGGEPGPVVPEEDPGEEEPGEDEPDKDDPDGDDPDEDDPDEDDPDEEKKKAKAQDVSGSMDIYSRLTDYVHRIFLAMGDVEKAEAVKTEAAKAEAPEKFATYDVMLKQLETLIKM